MDKPIPGPTLPALNSMPRKRWNAIRGQVRVAGAGGGQAQVQVQLQVQVGAVAMLCGTLVQHHLGKHEYTGTTHGSQSYTLLLPG